jgi:predicted  nucleic acid-binding Zn-ribbon protein
VSKKQGCWQCENQPGEQAACIYHVVHSDRSAGAPEDRDTWKARAEKAESERDAMAKRITVLCDEYLTEIGGLRAERDSAHDKLEAIRVALHGYADSNLASLAENTVHQE